MNQWMRDCLRPQGCWDSFLFWLQRSTVWMIWLHWKWPYTFQWLSILMYRIDSRSFLLSSGLDWKEITTYFCLKRLKQQLHCQFWEVYGRHNTIVKQRPTKLRSRYFEKDKKTLLNYHWQKNINNESFMIENWISCVRKKFYLRRLHFLETQAKKDESVRPLSHCNK